jgi:peptide/nickel transport system permease protein
MKRAARLLGMFGLTLLGLVGATFFIGRVVPIDPALALVGDKASPEAYAAARAALGLDRPMMVQFLGYLWDALRLDLGRSALTANPVAEDIARVFPATLELATTAMVLGIGLGVPAGVWAAYRRDLWSDAVIRVVCLAGYSAPVFWLGLVALAVFYADLGWASGPGRIAIAFEDDLTVRTGIGTIDALLTGRSDLVASAFGHLVLPSAVLGWYAMAYIARMTRSLMIAELAQDYVLAARAKGLSESRILWRHALGNAAVPLVTVIAITYGHLLEGSVLTETVFAWPGLGFYLTSALLNADTNAVLGATLVVGTVFLALNLLSDALYRKLDPRVR